MLQFQSARDLAATGPLCLPRSKPHRMSLLGDLYTIYRVAARAGPAFSTQTGNSARCLIAGMGACCTCLGEVAHVGQVVVAVVDLRFYSQNLGKRAAGQPRRNIEPTTTFLQLVGQKRVERFIALLVRK